MSMLAERRRKQKWSLNPRGKAWSEDNSKFGQKLLEKMGWSHGKGLGAKENGMIEHVKVSYKNDSQGVGYKEKDDQWTEHESNFTALLSSLRGEEPEEVETKLTSLEEKSQTSKYRVHYKKFTRGKDLSKCSEKDLASIFGKRSLSELKKTKPQKEIATEEGIEENAPSNKLFSNAGLISDYFKKKLPNFGKFNGYVIGNDGVLKSGGADSESETDQRPAFSSRSQDGEQDESESEARIGFGFSHSNNVESNIKEKKSTFISYVNGDSLDMENGTKKKKKDKKRPLEEAEDTSDIPSAKKKKLEPQEQAQVTVEKKKKKKLKNRPQEEVGLSNPAFDPLHTPVKMTKHVLEPIEEKLDESNNDSSEVVGITFETEVEINNEATPKKRSLEFEAEVVKNNKKKKKKTGKENMSIVNGDEDVNSSVQSETKKKKKAKKETTSSTDDNEDIITNSHEEVNNQTKKKKKARKDISSSMDDNEDSSISFENVNTSTQFELKKKKKKAKEDTLNGVCFNTIDLSVDDQQDGVFLGTIDLTQNKKSKKSSIVEEVSTENGKGVVSTKKIKKTKTSLNLGVDNPGLNLSIEDELPETRTKTKKKSKRDKDDYAAENPVFNGEDTADVQDLKNEEFELKRKDKSKKKDKNKSTTVGLDNPALNLTNTTEEQEEEEETLELMFNVVSTPIVAKPPRMSQPEEESASIRTVKSVSRRKSVHFNDVTRERIIPNKEEVQNESFDQSIVEVTGKLNDSAQLGYGDRFVAKKKKKLDKGLVNRAFDQHTNALEEDLTSISKTLDQFQAEVENDINEGKEKTTLTLEDFMVGEVGNPDGDNEKLEDGSVKLKFKHAHFRKSLPYMQSYIGAKKTYKHLIKGDIIVDFKETNLHEITGYASAKTA